MKDFLERHWGDCIALLIITLGAQVFVWANEALGRELIVAGLALLGLRRGRAADLNKNGNGISNIT